MNRLRRAKRWLHERAVLQAARATRPAPPARLDLALAVPVKDDRDGLMRLLDQARGMGIFSQIVVVDDGSLIPLPPLRDITLRRHETALGGGVARNAALDLITAQHVLFFDADDLLTVELPHLVADLAGQGEFDFCMFKYCDSRTAAEFRWAQPDWDEHFWALAGHSVGALIDAAPNALPVLAKTANYPWNKIYRTAFLRDNGIGCASTAVHQDIPLHWLGFICAKRVLTSDRICAWHHVDAEGGRLTNRRGRERLEVFRVLDQVAQHPATDDYWGAALADFSFGLVDWIERNIDPELVGELRQGQQNWLGGGR